MLLYRGEQLLYKSSIFWATSGCYNSPCSSWDDPKDFLQTGQFALWRLRYTQSSRHSLQKSWPQRPTTGSTIRSAYGKVAVMVAEHVKRGLVVHAIQGSKVSYSQDSHTQNPPAQMTHSNSCRSTCKTVSCSASSFLQRLASGSCALPASSTAHIVLFILYDARSRARRPIEVVLLNVHV